MARKISKDGPQSLDEAVYLLDRGQLRDKPKGRSRAQVIDKLRERFGEDGPGSQGGDQESQYASMTVAELREEAGKRGINAKGAKPALINRLEEDDAAVDAEPEEWDD